MKKNVFYHVMMLAMIAVVSMTFTACGGDSDDDGTPQVPTGPTGSTEYVEPCLDFGCSPNHVKEWMAGYSWELSEYSNDYTLIYMNSQGTIALDYMFLNSKMHTVAATYVVSGESVALAFKSEIEKRYGVTMTKETDPSDVNQYVYHCTPTINQRSVAIMMTYAKQCINILYSLPD